MPEVCMYLLTAHKLFPQSWPIRLFLATVVVETIVDLAIQGDIYARLSAISTNDQTEKSAVRQVVIYLGLFAFAQSVPDSHLPDCIRAVKHLTYLLFVI